MEKRLKGYRVEDDTIIMNRSLNKLDLFVKDFIGILKKHTDYLIVSGFVSICTGRTRATEDVDIITPVIGKQKFKALFLELYKQGFWCFQDDDVEEVYPYIENLDNIRFAKKDEMFPNIELVPFDHRKKAKVFEFTHPQKIRVEDFEFKIPQIEFEILYKEIVLATKKDIEDAKHLRTFFSNIIKEEKFKKYKPIILSELK